MKRVIALYLIILANFAVNTQIANAQNIILTDANPDTIIATGITATVYGTAVGNHVIIKNGASATLINFSGINTVAIESDSTLFLIFRSGATVTFQGDDGTLVQMPSTATNLNHYF